ncbi:L-histidine N(alpha)-methyltransferase [Rubrivivax albus]|uniref:L-histidine N(Alpha)-methyltransferase n=1 Tax=Rubrivivax albus TaxID=2499835 RepID=A0A437K159_9BURK|nr:L-histidine N(alpha)-methyltransferase [Rubrivivax albus]RVT54040.1 L-histidine N(alpha)-methyltransferase [Rubrivivax albus]
MREPAFVQRFVADAAAVRQELLRGLASSPARVAPKFFYDLLGSRLFDAITALDEYYPTRTEAALFAAHAGDMARACGTGRPLVDLGAGNCAKAASLFPALAPSQYVAVDISVDFLRDALTALQQRHPALPMLGLGLDFSAALDLPDAVMPAPRTLFYPGSSIGNFTPDEALALLRRMHAACDGGALLIGVDGVKDTAVLEAAYDDPLGVTAAFNLNLLRHVNALIGSDFDPRRWRHVAFFDAAASRIEMHLEAREAQTVCWPGGERRFAAGERVHTENSCKYLPGDFEALLHDAGFRRARRWSDDRGWFHVFAAQA